MWHKIGGLNSKLARFVISWAQFSLRSFMKTHKSLLFANPPWRFDLSRLLSFNWFFYYLQIFAGMRTQHTSTLRQAQPRRGAGCLKRPSVSRHSTFIWLFRFVTCHRYMMAFVTFRGTVITFVTAIGPVLWYDLSHRSLLHQLKQFTDIKSWDELSKKGSFSKKRNVMFSTKKIVTLTRNDLRNLRIHQIQQGTWNMKEPTKIVCPLSLILLLQFYILFVKIVRLYLTSYFERVYHNFVGTH